MDARFKMYLEQLDLLREDKKVLLAVSGGVDSIVLFHLMQKYPDVQLIIAHVNHSLRPEANKEEEVIKQLAQSYDVPCYVYHWPKEQHPQSGFEEAARNVRYQFFKKVMDATNAVVLMTAHHQDDQVETMLMKLARGSALEQIAGIKPVQTFHQGLLVRPLLPFSKNELYHYAQKHNLYYMEDATNEELTYTRNRFRKNIIPLLKEENNQLNQHMEQFSRDILDLLTIANKPIEQAFDQVVLQEGKKFTLYLKPFFTLSSPLQRAVLKRLLEKLYRNETQRYKTTHLKIILDWLQATDGNSQLDLTNGVVAEKAYELVMFYKKRERNLLAVENEPILIPKPLNSRVSLSFAERLVIEKVPENFDIPVEESVDFLIFHEGMIEFPLTVRHRQPGDRMTYKGLNGTKKIKDILMDEKVPGSERDKVWLVEDAAGRIIWLIGYRKMYLLSDEETDKITYILKYTNKVDV